MKPVPACRHWPALWLLVAAIAAPAAAGEHIRHPFLASQSAKAPEEVLLAVVAIPLALFLGKTGVDRSILIGSIILILIVEILNSAIEAVVDKASPEKHELAKRAKDMGSAAVLFSLINAGIVWACILWP